MDRREENGWLIYQFGRAVRVAICPSPWESHLVMLLLEPTVEGKEYTHLSALLPADPELPAEAIQKALGLTVRRAEAAHGAFLDALAVLTEEEDAPPPRPVIPIVSR